LSGNASSATTAGQIDGIEFRNGNSTNGAGPDTINDNGIGYITGVSLLGQTDGALYSQAYSSSWVHQIFGDYRTGQLAVRGRNNGTLTAWRTILDGTNYTSFAPTLTGSGASGNWGINVTGSAATLTTARTIAISGDVTGTATSFNGSANIAISAAITADSIVNADINSSAAIADTKLATIATAGKVSNSATTATNANTANAIVARDASGNFSAGTITATLSGNASTATTAASWTTARTITLGGDLSGSVSISGGANVTLTATIAANSVALGTDTTGNYVAGLTAGNGISVTGTAGEGWSPTVAMTGSYTGTFTATGDVCAYSDVTLKDNIEVISDPLTKVLKLRGVTFTRKDLDDNKTHMGVIAQEVEEVIPEVVITGDDGIKTVAYGNIVGLLIEAVKELTVQNKELAERVAQLESKLNG
jgi:hypothetical protein